MTATPPRTRRFPAALPGVPASVPRATSPNTAAQAHGAPRAATVASGVGLDSMAVRARMVDDLARRRLGNDVIWRAMREVPRHRFVDAALAAQAYEDTALPIGHGQTISKPSTVAVLLAAIGVQRGLGRVLDVGTGCGYQAALLARVCGTVYSIERVRALHERAVANLRPLQLPNLHLIHGDAAQLPEGYGQFDAIVSAASAADVPRAWYERLQVGGVLVAPVGQQSQQLLRVVRSGAHAFTEEFLEAVNFVPLQSGKK